MSELGGEGIPGVGSYRGRAGARDALTPYAGSLERVPYTRIRELGEIAMSMDGVLRLYFGELNLPTPRFIVDAAVRALKEGYTFYSENAGLPSLRREITGHYRRLHGVGLDPEREIVITASGVHALHLAIRSVVDPGDEAIVLSPAWPNNTSIIALSHGVSIDVPLALSGERYEIDFTALDAAVGPRTRLVVFTSPSNPLGWVADVREQQRLLEFCRDRDLWLLADEVYERIYYENDCTTCTGSAAVAEPEDRRELLHDRLARRVACHPCPTSGRNSPSSTRAAGPLPQGRRIAPARDGRRR